MRGKERGHDQEEYVQITSRDSVRRDTSTIMYLDYYPLSRLISSVK